MILRSYSQESLLFRISWFGVTAAVHRSLQTTSITTKRPQESLANQVLDLSTQSHRPLVRVAPSTVSGAGLGVIFQGRDNYDTTVGRPGLVACLYPGIYTPGLPPPSSMMEENVYLGAAWTPSGASPQDNAYILNLQDTGGYLDGQALMCNGHSRSLDENPSACGHLINHPIASADKNETGANVHVISFYWKDIIGAADASSRFNDEKVYDLPNQMRSDSSPWYLDSHTEEIVSFDKSPPFTTEHPGGSTKCHSFQSIRERIHPMLCGAAMVLTKEVLPGSELFLNYGLKRPFPKWADGWYS